MTRIALEIDDDLLALLDRHAKAANTSVERILTDHLTMIAKQNDVERQRQARKELLQLMEQSPLEFGDWKWNREELYDRVVLSGYERADLRSDTSDRR